MYVIIAVLNGSYLNKVTNTGMPVLIRAYVEGTKSEVYAFVRGYLYPKGTAQVPRVWTGIVWRGK